MNQPYQRKTATPSPFLPILAGFASLFIGIGLARFGYTPLLPAIIEADWFSPGQAAYLGAANFAGYLVGASIAWRIPVPLSPRATLRILLAATALSFAASSTPLSFEWMVFWRFLPGLTGGWIMVLAAPLILTAIPEARQRLAGGIFFAGVASGIVASGTLVPVLLSVGLETAWLGMAALMTLLLAIAWRGIPAGDVELPGKRLPAYGRIGSTLAGITVAYALFGFGICAHMLFFVDYVARGLGHGVAVGSTGWIVIGVSGLVGPVLAAVAARQMGTRTVLLLSYVGLAGGNVIAAASDGLVSAFLSAVLIGGLLTAVSTMTLAAVTESVPERRQRMRIWSLATAAFAIAQTAAAYAYSWLFAAGYPYSMLFLLAAVASALGLFAIWVSPHIRLRKREPTP